MITHVLSDNAARAPVFGLQSSLQLGDRPVAAKSGTTNDYHDAWLMGYTPSLAAGVWVGNNNNTAMKNRADGSIVAGPIWNTFLKRALQGTPNEPFINPEIQKTGKAVLDGSLGSQTVVVDRASGKRATEFTPERFKETRVFGGYHEILHFVDPKNPQTEIPEHPEKDPHYTAWESGVENWLQKRQKETGVFLMSQPAPIDFDDVHILSNTPTIRLLSPSSNSVIEGQSLAVSVNASAPRALSRVEFYIDDYFIAEHVSFYYDKEKKIIGIKTMKYSKKGLINLRLLLMMMLKITLRIP